MRTFSPSVYGFGFSLLWQESCSGLVMCGGAREL